MILLLRLLTILGPLIAPQLSGSPDSHAVEDVIFLCPGKPAVCSWSSGEGWKVLWTAEVGTEREQLSIQGGSSGLYVLHQKTPYGGTFVVFSPEGRILAFVDQGNPLEASASVGHDAGGAVVLCSGVGHKACSTWIMGGETHTMSTLPIFPGDCLFPRRRDGRSYCLKEHNALRNPKDPVQLSVWQDFEKPQSSVEHKLILPPGFVYDFMPLGKERALLVYEDGRVFDVHSWREVRGPIATGALRLIESAGRVYIAIGPLLAEKAAVLRVEDQGVKTVWTGLEIPAEIAGLPKERLLVRLEDRTSGRSKILLLEPKAQILWEEPR